MDSTAARALTVLIEKLEASDGPDRDLDGAIYELLGAARLPGRIRKPNVLYRFDRKSHIAPKFTASLDAALTLVPKGMGWGLQDIIGPRATIFVKDVPVDGIGATPALALCIAALKARAAGARAAALPQGLKAPHDP